MSDASLISALTSRIEGLERQTARLRRLFFGSLIALLCVGTAATTVAAQRSISFKDAAGNVISLDSAGFHLVDSAGHSRIKLGFNKAHGPALSFYDTKSVERIQIHVSSDGTPAIVLLDPQERARMFVGLTPDAPTQPRIEFRDTAGKQRLYVGLSTDETGMVTMFDAHDRKLADMEDTYLRFHDASATERLYLGLSPEARPFMEMFDSSHIERSYFGTYTNGDFGASMYDTSGEVSWHTP